MCTTGIQTARWGGASLVLIKANGSRLWRLRYEFEGVEKGISLGIDLDVSLKQARARHDAARRLIAEGIDPSANRQADKLAIAESVELITRDISQSVAR
jgi:Arm DNA-binding domain